MPNCPQRRTQATGMFGSKFTKYQTTLLYMVLDAIGEKCNSPQINHRIKNGFGVQIRNGGGYGHNHELSEILYLMALLGHCGQTSIEHVTRKGRLFRDIGRLSPFGPEELWQKVDGGCSTRLSRSQREIGRAHV